MKELIAALESATGPDRDLGNQILRAVGWREALVGHFHGPMYMWRAPDGKSYDDGKQPDPTVSVDAALTLVFGCRLVELMVETPEEGTDTACSAKISFTAEDPEYYGVSQTAPLALCIAALKARDATQG